MAATAVIVVGVIATVAVVAWILFAHSPEQTATHAGEPEAPGRVAGRSVAGPADAGAEAQSVPRAGEPGPEASPSH